MKRIKLELTVDQARLLKDHLVSLAEFEIDDKQKGFINRIINKIYAELVKL